MKMKFKTVVLTFSLMAAISALAQQPNFEWARNFGGTGSTGGEGVTTDSNGNVYTIGYYSGTVDFDPGPGTYTLSEVGLGDVFVSKMNANGNLVWARSLGGSSTDEGYSIAVDANGNVYACGRFYSTDFDPGSPSYTLSSNGSDDMFVCKFNASGTLQWARGFGSAGFDMASGITADANGDVYFTGYFSGTVDFNPATAIYNVSAIGSYDIFIYKMSTSGNLAWVHTFGTAANGLSGSKVTTDASGNVYVCGYLSGTIDFDPGPGTGTVSAPSATDLFVAKYTSSGNYIWARAFNGNSGVKWIKGIAVDASNNVFTTGSFNTFVDFDPGPSTYTLANTGLDMFVSKLDNNGNFAWAKRVGGNNQDYGTDVATDASGNVYVTSLFSGTVDFNPGTPVYTLTAQGNDDAAVIKLDNAGNFVFAYSFGDVNSDQAYGISVQADNIHLVGVFSGAVDFNPGAGTFSLTSSTSLYDVFVHKMGQCVAPAAPTTTGNIQACAGNSVLLSATSGSATVQWFNTLTATAAIATGTNLVSSSTLAPGVYTLYAEAQGCTVSAVRTPVSFTIVANPVLSITGNTFICTGETGNLNVTGAASYSWSNGATGASIAVSPTVATTYSVTGTDTNGCKNSASVTQSVEACTALKEADTAGNNLVVYPNPTNGEFVVALSTAGKVFVYSLFGAIVYESDVEANTHQISLNDKASGVYFVQMRTNGTTNTIRVIKN